ncbi:MAG: SusC/RagA family TonB-linked outer membrane protein [Gemmatimonadaceae bacterium]
MHTPLPSRWARRRVLSGTSKKASLGMLVMLLAVARPLLAQDTFVGGVVLTERSLRPVAGASVVADDTTRRATTDANGRFRLAAPTGTDVTLSVRRLGFRPLRHVARVGALDLRLVLSEAAVELSETIVTGTADATERRAIGNAVITIGAAEVMERGAVSTVQELLDGRAPGVVIQPGSGNVGSGGRITMRGGTSLTLDNEPLLYVDGVRASNAQSTGPVSQFFAPGPISRINDLDPDDIERVEIIKGPAAATLYGTEASTGVINVITKKGAVGPPRWSVGTRMGSTWLRDPEGRFPTNYGRDTAGNLVVLDIVERENARGTPIFSRGTSQAYHLGVSGGTELLRYYLSGGYERSDGVERANQLRKHSERLNVTIVPSDRLTLEASLGNLGGPTRLSPEGGHGSRIRATLNADPRNLPGGVGDTTRRGFGVSLPEEYDLFFERGGTFEQDLDRLTASLRVEHRTFSWLAQRLRAGYDRTGTTNTAFYPRVDALVAKSPYANRRFGYKEITVRDGQYYTIDYAATMTRALPRALRSNTSLGGQYYRNGTSRVLSSGADFPAEGLSAISSTTGSRVTEEDFVEDVTLGMYVEQVVAWRDRLFVTAALRADDNSAFGETFDRVYYPKAALSWVASDEPFFHLRWLETLRLRAAYGEAGKQPAAFDALRSYAPVKGPNDGPAVTPLSIGNPDLRPERGQELELGFDAAALDDRVSLELTYYRKHTIDAIVPRELAPSGGVPGVQLLNVGEIHNSGVELLARATPLRGKRWTWDLSLNLATNENTVVNLGDAALRSLPAGEYRQHRVGFPVGSWFERRVVSADMSTTGVASNVQCDDGRGGGTPCAGADGRYGTADDAPLVYLGRTIPRVSGAAGSTVTLLNRRLRLHALVDFKTGHHKFDFGTFGRCTTNARCRENFFPTEFDARRIASIATNGSLVDFAIMDASFAKLRELSATYTLPDRWAASFRASRASVSIAGRELHSWTRYGGLEPEATYLGGVRGGNYGNYEQNMLPQLSRVVVAVNLGY